MKEVRLESRPSKQALWETLHQFSFLQWGQLETDWYRLDALHSLLYIMPNDMVMVVVRDEGGIGMQVDEVLEAMKIESKTTLYSNVSSAFKFFKNFSGLTIRRFDALRNA